MLTQPTNFLLSLLTENEEVKKFPKEFVDASVKWIRSWFLIDDPIVEAVLDSKGNADIKAKVLAQKLPELQKNEQFVKELGERMAAYQRMKNVILNSKVDVKGNATIGDQQQESDNPYGTKNAIQGSEVSVGGDLHLGDKHTLNISNLHTGEGDIVQGGKNITNHYYGLGTKQPVGGGSANIKKLVRELIRNDSTEDAISALEDYAAKNIPDRYNDVLQLSGRYQALSRKEMKGLLSNAEATLERNQINDALLRLLDKIA